MDRMVQVGVVPMTWQQVLLEWQRGSFKGKVLPPKAAS